MGATQTVFLVNLYTLNVKRAVSCIRYRCLVGLVHF